MKIQRYFATKGTSVLYVDRDKADSLPKSIWDGFKRQVCGEGDEQSFKQTVRDAVKKDGWFVDE